MIKLPLRPTVLDLFAGAGGMALGFHGAGAKCIGAVESDQAAAETFALTFKNDEPVIFGGPVEGDVTELPVLELLDALPTEPDIVVGGPPCQGFSRIGKAKQASLLDSEENARTGGIVNPERNLLYRYFLNVVRTAQPLAFVMENVPGMREQLGADLARRIAREAHFLGYNVRYFLLNAAHYGVPQSRSRLFFVGIRADLGHDAIPEPPSRTHLPEEPKRQTIGFDSEDPWMVSGPDLPSVADPQPLVSVKDAIGDLPKLKAHLSGTKARDEPLPLRRAPSSYVEELRNWPGIPAPDLVTGNWYRYTERDFPIFRLMAQGDTYPEALEIANQLFGERLRKMADPPRPGSEEWKELKASIVPPYRNDAFHDKWKKLTADEPSWTITAHLSKDTYSHIHYDSQQARGISVREAARIQSFPDGIEFQGNHGQQFTQIGNAVPPILARAIARQLFSQLEELDAVSSDLDMAS